MAFISKQNYTVYMVTLSLYRNAGGGAIVETGTKEFAGELHHEQPLVYNNGTAVIILYGCLSNLEELFKWISSDKVAGSHSNSYGICGSLSSSRFQSQSHAAEALLEVYSQTGRRDHLIMLSELQVRAMAFISAQMFWARMLNHTPAGI